MNDAAKNPSRADLVRLSVLAFAVAEAAPDCPELFSYRRQIENCRSLPRRLEDGSPRVRQRLAAQRPSGRRCLPLAHPREPAETRETSERHRPGRELGNCRASEFHDAD